MHVHLKLSSDVSITFFECEKQPGCDGQNRANPFGVFAALFLSSFFLEPLAFLGKSRTRTFGGAAREGKKRTAVLGTRTKSTKGASVEKQEKEPNAKKCRASFSGHELGKADNFFCMFQIKHIQYVCI